MKLSQLEALIAIADGHGIAGAAKQLNISQPAITKSLSNLEHNLGVELLDRSGYRLKLNAYGNRLLTHARAIASEAEKAILDIKLMREMGQQLILVNGSPGTMPKLIPTAFLRARKNDPGLIIEFTGQLIGNPTEKYNSLSEGLYDLLIYPIEKEHDVEDFTYEPLMEVKLIVMAGKDHPATKLIKPSLKELRGFDWLSLSKEGLPHRLERQAFLDAGAKYPDNVQPLPLLKMIFSFLRTGDYLAFVPYHPAIIGDEIEEFTLINADMPTLKWTLHIIQRKSSIPSTGMQAFITELKGLTEMVEQETL